MYDINGIGERIALRRKQKGLTQENLAERLGVSPQAVSKWETGAGCPDIALLPEICRHLDLSMDELFGRIAPPEKPKGFDFPGRQDDLTLQGSLGGVACYAEHQGRQEGDTVTFEDGSEADLRAGTVVNRGAGDIRLLFAETLKDKHRPFENAGETAGGDLASVPSLNVQLQGASSLFVRMSKDGKMRWTAEGSREFLQGLEVKTREDVLYIVSRPLAQGRMMRGGKIELFVPSKRMETLFAKIQGSGNLESAVDFELSLVSVAGAGDVQLKDAGQTKVRLSGSGDFRAEHAQDGTFETAGSGDVRLNGVSGSLQCRASGAGDFWIEEGEVDELKLHMAGSGDFNARGLTAGAASVTLSGACDAVIGCVKGRSVETVSRASKLKILKRG